MHNYVIKAYQEGVEPEQARIGIEAARNWAWPFAYDQEDLVKIHAQTEFDPETQYYCYLEDMMVGFVRANLAPGEAGDAPIASLDFPRFLTGHEKAAEPLLIKIIDSLRIKGVRRVTGRVSTMCPEDILLAEKIGFALKDWGYKVYYSYRMEWGRLETLADTVEDIKVENDLDECAELAGRWYKRPFDWCRVHLQGWHDHGIIAHLGIREGGRLVASCMTAANVLRPSTAANYYIFIPDETYSRPLLGAAVNRCIQAGSLNLIADLINEHRGYEPVYQELGFKKVAEWARCEIDLE